MKHFRFTQRPSVAVCWYGQDAYEQVFSAEPSKQKIEIFK